MEDPNQIKAKSFAKHLRDVAAAFNAQSMIEGLGVELDVNEAVEQTLKLRNFRNILSFFGSEPAGVLFKEQIITAVSATKQLIDSPYNAGLILGALQSGKTTTALALQFAGPAVYLVTGEKLFPFYLTTNQNSHEEQIRNELAGFIKLYGMIDIRFKGKHCKLKNYIRGNHIHPVFAKSPNLDTYREVVLQGDSQFRDIYRQATLDDLIHKRVKGQAIRNLADSCHKMVKAGFTPLMIVDEPQFGASDRIVTIGGKSLVADCLLTQIEKEIRNRIGSAADKVKAIGLSATPFELHALDRVWKVFQRLGTGYRGFNEFAGQRIDPSVTILPPPISSMTDASAKYQIPFLPSVNAAAYTRNRAFSSWSRKSGYPGTWVQYKADCVAAIRALVIALVQRPSTTLSQGKPGGGSESQLGSTMVKPQIGICLRAINDNDTTEQLLIDLNLPSNLIEVVKFFGGAGKGQTVKQAIAARSKPHLPYIFLVTSKARMGDQFPSDVRYFIDFAQKATDLNSLLQGLVGRACGYGKSSEVFLSDQNSQIINNYVATTGGFVTKTSRHSIVTGGSSGTTLRQQVTILRDPSDKVLEKVFTEIDRKIVGPTVPNGNEMKPRRAPKGGRRGPLLKIAEARKLFDYIETGKFRAKHLPHVLGNMKIVRSNEQAKIIDASGNIVQGNYLIDTNGDCRFNFRNDTYAGRGGIKGRGRGRRDASDLSLNHGIIEPSIGLQKIDPSTGHPVSNSSSSGKWVAASVTFPLRDRCVVMKNATFGRVSLPAPLCVYDKRMTKRERAVRDGRVK